MMRSFQLFGPEAGELLSGIQTLSFQDGGEQLWSVAEITALLQNSGTVALVILEAIEPVGFLIWRQMADEAEILTIAVLPDYRGKGMGYDLLQEFQDQAISCDITKAFLEVREDNMSALRLYEKTGFEVVGRRKDYYGGRNGQKRDALVMKCIWC